MSDPKQTVNGDAGNVVSGDVTINNYSIETSPADSQLMSDRQRKHLNRLINELVDAGESRPGMWCAIHNKLNNENINEMTSADYHSAIEILEERRRGIKYRKDCNHLIGKIKRITDESLLKERDYYCLRRFGSSYLKDLDKEQLQEVFGYFVDLLNSSDNEKNTEQVLVGVKKTVKPEVTSKKRIFLWGLGLIIAIATLAGGINHFGKQVSIKERTINPDSIFTVDSSNSVINASLPSLRSVFPGLNKYKDALHSLATYRQKSGWHTLKFVVGAEPSVPESYGVRGHVCYINLNPEGDYARVSVASCRSLLLDQQDTPSNNYRFILK
ncbi:hypothetical protein [Serratia marcescens]|uniref:hypothetical protein n=1 Tax=Serratia marcescens TaxID=615 RepID=UPI00093363F6|nr:hypothetical protein [Serratia marcescens]